MLPQQPLDRTAKAQKEETTVQPLRYSHPLLQLIRACSDLAVELALDAAN
jgi:hypothetical protein